MLRNTAAAGGREPQRRGVISTTPLGLNVACLALFTGLASLGSCGGKTTSNAALGVDSNENASASSTSGNDFTTEVDVSACKQACELLECSDGEQVKECHEGCVQISAQCADEFQAANRCLLREHRPEAACEDSLLEAWLRCHGEFRVAKECQRAAGAE